MAHLIERCLKVEGKGAGLLSCHPKEDGDECLYYTVLYE